MNQSPNIGISDQNLPKGKVKNSRNQLNVSYTYSNMNMDLAVNSPEMQVQAITKDQQKLVELNAELCSIIQNIRS